MPTRLPLEKLKVLDLTAHRAGPTAVRQLADWGAGRGSKSKRPEVLKSMRPAAGAAARIFRTCIATSAASTLNLKAPEGLKIFFELAKDADVVVENFRSTVKHKLGVDYEAVKKINPRIVYGSISGFGQDGPYEGVPASTRSRRAWAG
jgi:crotonobetainyl-CoA:carnitine CoA-transferase CaiB-like acyl-CoA transferase